MLVLTRRPDETIRLSRVPDHGSRRVGPAPCGATRRRGPAGGARADRRGRRARRAADRRSPTGEPPSLVQLDQLVQKRLDIARLGLTELRRRLDCGQEDDAEMIRKKIDEDLNMLQRRIRREVEKAAPRSVPVRRAEVFAGPRLPR